MDEQDWQSDNDDGDRSEGICTIESCQESLAISLH